jgi:uncharacterized OsmC-like protein
MEQMERIRSTYIRTAKAIAKHASLAQYSSVATARMTDGLTCEIKAGAFTVTADLPEVAAGNHKGPTPSELGEAAVASCVAIGIAMTFADLGVPYSKLEVEVQGKYDIRTAWGVPSDAPAGFGDLSYTVRVQSPAPEAEIMNALDRADARSFWLDNLRRPIEIRREVQISAPA